jgi:hypothetical protein
MDEALRPRERQLLATLPARLELHVERLQQAATRAEERAEAATGDRAEGSAQASAQDDLALHQRCHREMQQLLLAELDLRLEPVEGLLEALREETEPTP